MVLGHQQAQWWLKIQTCFFDSFDMWHFKMWYSNKLNKSQWVNSCLPNHKTQEILAWLLRFPTWIEEKTLTYLFLIQDGSNQQTVTSKAFCWMKYFIFSRVSIKHHSGGLYWWKVIIVFDNGSLPICRQAIMEINHDAFHKSIQAPLSHNELRRFQKMLEPRSLTWNRRRNLNVSKLRIDYECHESGTHQYQASS